MTPIVNTLLNQMTDAHRKGSSLALFFDYDGTLTPIVEQPWLARLERGMRRLLARLARHPRLSVAIVSGRRLDDLKSLCFVRKLQYAGSSGMEIEFDGTRLTPPKARRHGSVIRRLVERFNGIMAGYPGAWVEDKGLTITLHYRHLDQDRIEPLRAWVRQALHPWAGQVRAVAGPMAIEIVPEIGWNKGSAVRFLVDQLSNPDIIPLYAGDGANDIEALEVADNLGGISLGIGPDAPQTAQHRLSGPSELKELLLALDRSLRPEPGRSSSASQEALALHGQWKSLLSMHGL